VEVANDSVLPPTRLSGRSKGCDRERCWSSSKIICQIAGHRSIPVGTSRPPEPAGRQARSGKSRRWDPTGWPTDRGRPASAGSPGEFAAPMRPHRPLLAPRSALPV